MGTKGIVLAVACLLAAAAFGGGPDVTGLRAYDLPAYTLVTSDPSAAQAAVPKIGTTSGHGSRAHRSQKRDAWAPHEHDPWAGGRAT